MTLREPSDTSKLTAHVSDITFQIDASRTMAVAPKGDDLFLLNFWMWQDSYLERIRDGV